MKNETKQDRAGNDATSDFRPKYSPELYVVDVVVLTEGWTDGPKNARTIL